MRVAEILRQVEGAGLEKNGWVGGCTWFGSVSSCVELKKSVDANSAFITKNITKFFPIIPLYRLLKERHGDRPTVHWSVMAAVMPGIKTMAIACTWS